MSFHRFRASGYEDERRRPYGYEPARYESYKPIEDRGHPRDQSRDFERDRSRDTEQGQGRRELFDVRDSRDQRTPQSPHSIRKEMGSPKNLHIDTRVVNDPRRSSSSAQSAASAISNAPTEPALNRIAKLNNIPSSAVTTTVPKARDPKAQGIFDVVYQWNSTLQERMLLNLRKGKFSHEDQRRQLELGKIGSKVDDYAPYSEFQQRFEESGKAEREDIVKQSAELDRRYAEDLEKVASSLSSQAPSNPQMVAQAALLSRLEAELAKIQKLTSEQQNQIAESQAQIQTLRSDQEKSAKVLDALNKDVDTLKSENTALKAKNAELEQQQFANLEAMKRAQDYIDRLSGDLQSFMPRMADVEGKMHPFIEKVEDFDMDTYNEILETWINHDFKNKVISNEISTTAIRQNLQSFQEAATSRFDKTDMLVQDTRNTLGTMGSTLDTLGNAFETSRKARQATAQPSGQSLGGNQLELQAFVEERLSSFNEVIQKTLADSGDACAEMVDDLRVRHEKLEALVKTLVRLEALLKDPDIKAHISALQQTMRQHGLKFDRLEGRIESIEGQRFSRRIDSVDVGLADLERKVQSFQENNVGGRIANPEAVAKIVQPDINDAKRRFEALEMSIRVLDTQWSNLTSKQMAERILQQLDPYGQRTEARIARLENELLLAKNEILQAKTIIAQVEEQTRLSMKDKKLAEMAKTYPVNGKRLSSPGSAAEDSIKKRKLSSNGQCANQPHRSSSNNL
ncbi:hypothetical protein F4804DRAFT_283647 [Jackrogersella minutella]|nr:hypothetical protein F4804DRAFT_283647 [Jackrogersella minutella]